MLQRVRLRANLCSKTASVWAAPPPACVSSTGCRSAGISTVQQMAPQARKKQRDSDDCQTVPLLADAHSHPQLDPANMHRVLQLQCCHLAAMSVCHDVDWHIMAELHQLADYKVIPGFGIHPWWAHLHASSHGNNWQELLEALSQEQLQQAINILSNNDPVTNSGAYATNRKQAGSSSQNKSRNGYHNYSSRDSIDRGSSCSDSGSQQQVQHDGEQQIQNGEQQQQPKLQQEQGGHLCLGNGLRVVPLEEWEGKLRSLLQNNPHAFVGEIGIDRAAQIPGSKAKTSFNHQLELLERQVALAAEFQRPVSIHCVRGYGHLLQFFQQLAKQPSACPPKVMLHSYGGSLEEIPRFHKLKGIGERFYFSFSHVINQRTPDKLVARIAAVPSDRLLIESDQVGGCNTVVPCVVSS
eukprot:GHRR01014049.1.p1 GENE.GHRR01014049.1~~GHRR01014049.1.p1  ORF type:complete len:410 (+),score=116.67 GHRR01014049.1:85-1314(+)